MSFFIVVRILPWEQPMFHDDVDAFLLDDRNRRAPSFGPRKDTLNTIVDRPSTRILLLGIFRDICERHIFCCPAEYLT